jgi:cytochrome c oxidase assembly protein subunit 11
MARPKHTQLVVTLVSVAAGMLMLAYAAVPLYQLFCQVTGFGGTTMRAESAPLQVNERVIEVRFNADHDPNLPWEFTPLERTVRVKVGENRLIAYHAKNITDQPTRGTATYNVTPHAAGKYFNKIQCFCFQEQRLDAGEKVTMPVSFFIDPAILDDDELRNLQNITLSYTFFNYESANQSKLN